MVADFAAEFRRYRALAEKAMAQVSDDALNHVPGPDANSIAMLVRHVSGNLRSRFTDFLTSDGEKPWRDRDTEFAEQPYSRDEMNAMWAEGWGVLELALTTLSEADAQQTVQIRGESLTVHQALNRALAHVAYHVGQIVLLARVAVGGEWHSLSIPKGQSPQYNRRPTLDKPPAR